MFSFLKPYVWAITAVVWLVTVVGASYVGMDYGESKCKSRSADIKEAAQASYDASQKASAEAIAKIEVKHEQIIQPLRTTVREKLVYTQCKHDADGLRLINEALTNSRANPVNDSKLSEKSRTSK